MAYGSRAVAGFSMGGAGAVRLSVLHPELFAAVSPNNGIGPMPDAVLARVKELKAKSDVRTPMMICEDKQSQH